MIKRQRRALGVPAHPLLVHFPIAFWLAVPLFDLGALFVGEPWITMALGATVTGVVIGAAAVVTGLLEYMQPSLAVDSTCVSLRGMEHELLSHGAYSRSGPLQRLFGCPTRAGR